MTVNAITRLTTWPNPKIFLTKEFGKVNYFQALENILFGTFLLFFEKETLM